MMPKIRSAIDCGHLLFATASPPHRQFESGGGDLVQVATSKPGPEDMIVQVLATGVRRTDLHLLEEPSRATARRSSAVTRPRFRPTSGDAAYSGSNRSRVERRYGSRSHPWSKEANRTGRSRCS